ncbi:MAG TPA: NAD(P)-dependent oxidoreductase [Candidatus Saccharimonadales bacterium]|nr:NAD(P)-dependent oxidoreductase [Candidatus Saccharimonadales bacterium]
MFNPLSTDLDECLSRTQDLWAELRDQRIFITGATGFFGCWLLETLLHANRQLNLNAQVTILTRNSEEFKKNAPHLATDPALHTVGGDIRSFPFPPGRYSHVIHAATESSVPLNTETPMVMFDTIVEGTRRCLEFAQHAETAKFLFLSSGAVYGPQPPDTTHVSENATTGPNPLETASAYAEGKRAAELLCAIAAKGTALQPKIARGFAFVGPYMKLDAHFAIGNFIRDQLAGRTIRVTGDGTALRSYMYTTDLMVWLWTILFRGAPLRPYNVGSEQAVSIRELAQSVSEALIPKVEFKIFGTPGTVPPQRYVPSTARAQQELGLRCEIPLDEAIRRTQRWFLNRDKVSEVSR